MDVWDVLWVAWIVLFFVIELPAIWNENEGDTLSEHFQEWFHVDSRIGRAVWLVVSGVFFAWFTVHIWSGSV